MPREPKYMAADDSNWDAARNTEGAPELRLIRPFRVLTSSQNPLGDRLTIRIAGS